VQDVLPLLVNACSEACLETVEGDKRARTTLGIDSKCHRGGLTGEGQHVDHDLILTKSAASGVRAPSVGLGDRDDALQPAEEKIDKDPQGPEQSAGNVNNRCIVC